MSIRLKWLLLLAGAILLVISVQALAAADNPPPRAGNSAQPASRAADSPAITVCRQQGVDGYFDAQDTDIDAYDPNKTNGYDASLRIKSDNTRNFLIQFVMPDLPHNITVSEATLRMWVSWPTTKTYPLTINLYRVRRVWTDVDASWNNATAGFPWQLPGCNDLAVDRYPNASAQRTVTDPATWIEFDVTGEVIDWLASPWDNHGYLARGQGDHTVQYNFASGEHPETYHRPELCITYYEATPTPTITQTPTVTATPTPTATHTNTPTITPSPTPSTGNIHGIVWHDVNGNGRRDHEEPPLPNAQIVLRTAAGALMMLNTTGGDGSYEMPEILPGVYWLQEIDPPGYVSTTLNDWMIPIFANTRIEIHFGDQYAPTVTATHTGTPTSTPTATTVPCRDYFEPDDDPPNAKTISTEGVLQGHNIHQPGDVDYVKFGATAGLTYILRTANLGGGVSNDTKLTLLAPDGVTVLAVNDDSPSDPPASRIEWICPESGNYFMRVAQYNPSIGGCHITYDLSVQRTGGTPTVTATPTRTPTRMPHINVLPLIVRQ
jgi:hypothetical protein